MIIAAISGLLAAGAWACDNVDEIEIDGRHDAGTDADTDVDGDADSDGDTDSDGDGDVECDTDYVPDYESAEDCMWNSGWPSMCQNTWYCDNGAPCQGYDGLMNGSMGACAPQCDEPFECPTEGLFGMGVAEICDTYLVPDGCMCLLSGCEDSWDCPAAGHCVEPSCIPTDTGCPEGEGEEKVCYPDNW
jgi:hypothetical protein